MSYSNLDGIQDGDAAKQCGPIDAASKAALEWLGEVSCGFMGLQLTVTPVQSWLPDGLNHPFVRSPRTPI